jgi:hypothetical protein
LKEPVWIQTLREGSQRQPVSSRVGRELCLWASPWLRRMLCQRKHTDPQRSTFQR